VGKGYELMNDRALQDELIRYLTDAHQRRQGPGALPIAPGQARKATQFSHFLARHYYRDRLTRSFQYSRQFREITGRRAEEVVDFPQFDSFLESCVLGSLAAAEAVGASASAYLADVPHPVPWWNELLEYEYAYLLQTATSDNAQRPKHPTRGTSATLRQFSWGLPEGFAKLREGTISADLCRREVTLLFSRTQSGKIYVLEVEAAVAKVFRAADGSRGINEMAAAAEIPADEVLQVLEALAAIGAVVNPPRASTKLE
jgi:hypothetical protein